MSKGGGQRFRWWWFPASVLGQTLTRYGYLRKCCLVRIKSIDGLVTVDSVDAKSEGT